MAFPGRGDEARHEPGGDPWWEEAWDLDFAADDGTFGGHVRLGLLPNQGVSWVWAAVVGDGRRLVTVVEHEAPLPRRGSLDLRCEGLWTDFVCEEPLVHWSVGLEAFGVALDEPVDALGDLWGERIGVGFDLGWETVTGAPTSTDVDGRYDLHCVVSGEVLLGDEVVTFDGWGSRHHTWGTGRSATGRTSSASGRLDDASRWLAVAGPEDPPTAGAPTVVADRGPDHLPVGAEVHAGDDVHHSHVRHLSPVPLPQVAGRPSAVDHALCATTAADGRTGSAWVRLARPPN